MLEGVGENTERGGGWVVNQYLQIIKLFNFISIFMYATLLKGARVCTQLLCIQLAYI